MKIEIVTHCFHYATLLHYQLSSLVIHPPPEGAEITVTVFHTNSDERTGRVLASIQHHQATRVRWNWKTQPVPELCMRSIGRNQAALSTQADWVWFTDADYWFTTPCWKWFADHPPGKDAVLIYPRRVMNNHDHALGDACIEKAREADGLVAANPHDYFPRRMNKAIGGVQIVPGRVAREKGYLKDMRKAQRPVASCQWGTNAEDVWFRRNLGTDGVPQDIPGVFRIRHSKAGRHEPGIQL